MTDWQRYRDNGGTDFWWHPDDDPPQNSTLVEKPMTTTSDTVYVLDPPIQVSKITFKSLEVVWSDLQGCDFLIAHGVDEQGEHCEDRVSVNLNSDRQKRGYMFVRTDDYNAHLVAELFNRDILIPTGIVEPSGWITLPLCFLSILDDETTND